MPYIRITSTKVHGSTLFGRICLLVCAQTRCDRLLMMDRDKIPGKNLSTQLSVVKEINKERREWKSIRKERKKEKPEEQKGRSKQRYVSLQNCNQINQNKAQKRMDQHILLNKKKKNPLFSILTHDQVSDKKKIKKIPNWI